MTDWHIINGERRDYSLLWIIVILISTAQAWAVEGPIINEIHYDSVIKTEWVEFVELYNPTSMDIDLGGWALAEAVEYTFPAGAVIPADGYVVVAQDVDALTSMFATTWINPDRNYGPFQGRLNNQGESVVLLDATGRRVDEVDYQLGFPWPTIGDLPAGQGHSAIPSIQLVHPSLQNDLGGHWRPSVPTPGISNAFILNPLSPPAIRRVRVEPEQPLADETVLITARVTDVNGVAAVNLFYQIVDPGRYIHKNDGRFWQDWKTLTMRDDGRSGDLAANDGTYSVLMPASLQQHRRLVRFRIEAMDSLGEEVTVPYEEDPQPNFAYFVYNGVPPWTAAVRPGIDAPQTYSPEVLTKVPVYHLISKKDDVERATWLEKYGGNDYKWMGTLVVDGRVYDHVPYRARGGVWRYAMGKNMWKFNFNRGHSLEARNDYGKKYRTTWDRLNLSACIQQGSYGHRGEQGMFEAVGFKMFDLMGVPSPRTHWLHLRIIDEADEVGGTQYDGDFWGLYLAMEQMDGRFLDERGLPDGNLYKIEGHNVEGGQASNEGPYGPDDFSDFYSFKAGYYSGSNPSEAWWRNEVDLEGYYSYRCVVEGIHHGDIGYGKNYYFYFNPETQRTSQLPWDLDLTWDEGMYGNGRDPFLNQGAIFSRAALNVEYQNRLREFVDLFYNTDQAWQLIDELAAVIDDPNGGPAMVDADRAMWDYHWVVANSAHPRYLSRPASHKAGQGKFYEAVSSRDFPGMVQLMKDYIPYVTNSTRNWHGQSGPSLLSLMADNAIPDTPVIRYTGTEGYPINDLQFTVDPFADPQGRHTFGALMWRIGEVESFSEPAEPLSGASASEQVLVEAEEQWSYFKGRSEPPGSTGQWRTINYQTAQGNWQQGVTPVGYGENWIRTVLSDMRYNYSTVYLRKEFTVDDPSLFDELTLYARYDDAFAAWINGTVVHVQNLPGADLPYNANAPGNQEQTQLRAFTLNVPDNLLRQGWNVLAVHLVNLSLATSSDCFFDARLVGTQASEDTTTSGSTSESIVIGRPGHYEVQALWNSGEITPFTSDVQIPASILEPGHTYRVRCRMKDTSGRWSHWSAPIQFTAQEAMVQALHQNLRITEFMFNPPSSEADDVWNNDDFEFIELRNIGSSSLDMASLQFERGISFNFAQAEKTRLAKGETILLVSNRTAFIERYGSTWANRIVGEYTGQLSNSGEHLTLTDYWAGVIFDFRYQDDWYDNTDGDGHSLVLKFPANAAIDQLDQMAQWQASPEYLGSPGR